MMDVPVVSPHGIILGYAPLVLCSLLTLGLCPGEMFASLTSLYCCHLVVLLLRAIRNRPSVLERSLRRRLMMLLCLFFHKNPDEIEGHCLRIGGDSALTHGRVGAFRIGCSRGLVVCLYSRCRRWRWWYILWTNTRQTHDLLSRIKYRNQGNWCDPRAVPVFSCGKRHTEKIPHDFRH